MPGRFNGLLGMLGLKEKKPDVIKNRNTAPKYEEKAVPKRTKKPEEERGADMDIMQHRSRRGVKLQPLDVIEGFQVRPGFYNRDGATATSNGVSFTIHSIGATGCTLLLFRPQEKEPYARLTFPESYHIGNTYSMLVFGLKIEEFEYAFQLDGPYDRECFSRKKMFCLTLTRKLLRGKGTGGSVPNPAKNLYIMQGLWRIILTGAI